MEMFSASNEEQFKYIKKIIDDCDYYVLVLGGRYGSVNVNSGKSFTEMEYEYALEKGIPILSFVHKDPQNLPAEKREKEHVDLFDSFRVRVLENSKMSKMWSEKSDLVANVVVSLVQMVDEFPRIGWSRGGQDVTELLSQINKLRVENELLKNQKNELLANEYSNPVDIKNLSQGDDVFYIEGKKYTGRREFFNVDTGNLDTIWDLEQDVQKRITWNEMFKYVAPEIFVPCDERIFRDNLNNCCEEVFKIDDFEISRKSYHLIKYQMLALNWISISVTKDMTMLKLTEEGKKVFMNIITIKK